MANGNGIRGSKKNNERPKIRVSQNKKISQGESATTLRVDWKSKRQSWAWFFFLYPGAQWIGQNKGGNDRPEVTSLRRLSVDFSILGRGQSLKERSTPEKSSETAKTYDWQGANTGWEPKRGCF